MKMPALRSRRIALLAVLLPLLALFVFVVFRSGPLAPVPVTVAQAEERSLRPAVFGVGLVEARYLYRVGPTAPGRVKAVAVQVGDRVRAGDLLGEMDALDLEARQTAQMANLRRAEAALHQTEAQLEEWKARHSFALAQALRYEGLRQSHAASDELLETRQQEKEVARAALGAAYAAVEVARSDVERGNADLDALRQQARHLRLVAPVDGLVTQRASEPGTTVVAGQTVIEIVDPEQIWINVRFDQRHAGRIEAGLPAQIHLRSQAGEPIQGRVLRVEPTADAVTEELLAKVVFTAPIGRLPPLGELAEVTVSLPALPPTLTVPNASVQRRGPQTGVWQVAGDRPEFAPVVLGARDLEGRVQVLQGLRADRSFVLHSLRALAPHQRVEVVDQLPGLAR